MSGESPQSGRKIVAHGVSHGKTETPSPTEPRKGRKKSNAPAAWFLYRRARWRSQITTKIPSFAPLGLRDMFLDSFTHRLRSGLRSFARLAGCTNRVPRRLGSDEVAAVWLPLRHLTWQQRQPTFIELLTLSDEKPQAKPNGGYVCYQLNDRKPSVPSVGFGQREGFFRRGLNFRACAGESVV